jgi:hypothetical protein
LPDVNQGPGPVGTHRDQIGEPGQRHPFNDAGSIGDDQLVGHEQLALAERGHHPAASGSHVPRPGQLVRAQRREDLDRGTGPNNGNLVVDRGHRHHVGDKDRPQLDALVEPRGHQ